MDGFKINFYLSKVGTNKVYSRILISVAWNKNRIRTTLNMPVEEKLWNSKKQRIKASASNPRKINDKLDELRVKLNEFYDTTRKERKTYPTKEEVKNLVTAILKDQKIPKPKVKRPRTKTFLQHFKEFIKATASGERLSDKGKPIGYSTIQSYKTTYNHLVEFTKSTGFQITFENIDEIFYSKFTKYLSKRNLLNNSQGNGVVPPKWTLS